MQTVSLHIFVSLFILVAFLFDLGAHKAQRMKQKWCVAHTHTQEHVHSHITAFERIYILRVTHHLCRYTREIDNCNCHRWRHNSQYANDATTLAHHHQDHHMCRQEIDWQIKIGLSLGVVVVLLLPPPSMMMSMVGFALQAFESNWHTSNYGNHVW